MKIKKTYKFAFLTSVYLSIFTFVISYLLTLLSSDSHYLKLALIFSLIVFILSFVIIVYRVERFIYSRVKKIYDDVSMLSLEDLKKKDFTSDIELLSKEVKKFAEDKRLKIETLEIREKYRREFLGNVSHELKTPLFTVQGYLLTLADGAIEDKNIRDKYLLRANKSVERLVEVVQDLDMISKFESGYLIPEYKMFNIVQLIQNVFEMLEIKAKKRNIQLGFDKVYSSPILVNADEKRIEQVLINLIVNSIKYGEFTSDTTVQIKNYDEHKVIIVISDKGEGIKEEHLSRLFERFYRVDHSRSRDEGGSGLGLSIVKHILEAHDQEVFVESQFGKGSTFSFTLEKFE